MNLMSDDMFMFLFIRKTHNKLYASMQYYNLMIRIYEPILCVKGCSHLHVH